MKLNWNSGEDGDQSCPSCDKLGPHQLVLTVADGPHSGMRLLSCAACSATHYDPMPSPDYGLEPKGGNEALTFYLQQGAGIWSIAANVLPLELPGKRRLLEIGCGFGFGLDVARHIRGWEIAGFDPSPLAGAGAEQLNLPIANRYFTPDEGEVAAYDAVICSEVVEHLFHPVDIIRLLRSALRPGGVLVVTTPNAGAIMPEMSPGILVPLLSIGLHTILHTAASLESLLRAAGFTSVAVEDRGPQLLAHASDAGTPWRKPNDADRMDYRRYLEDAGMAAAGGSDLRLGLLVRAYREAVASGSLVDSDRIFEPLRADITARYGAAPEDLADNGPVSLAQLAREWPLNLGPLLYARAMHLRLQGVPFATLHPLLGRAAAATERLRTALAGIETDDGDAEELSWAARAEQMLSAAEAGEPVQPGQLGLAPGNLLLARTRLASVRRRCFVTLVNQGRLDLAAELADVITDAEARAERGETLGEDDLDVLFCGTVFATNRQPGDPDALLRLLRCLGKLVPKLAESDSGGRRAAWLAGLRRQGFVTLVNQGKPDLAAELADVVTDAEARAERGETLGEDELDVLFCGTVFATNRQPGDPDALLRLLRCLGKLVPKLAESDSGGRRTAWLAGLRRQGFITLVNQGELVAAAKLADVVTEAEARAERGEALGEDELDVLFCGTVFATNRQPSDPDALMRLLHCLGKVVPRLAEADPDGRRASWLSRLRGQGYVSLVNQGRLDLATKLADAVSDAEAKAGLGGTLDDTQCNVLFCGAVAAANSPPGDPETAIRLTRCLRAAILRGLPVQSGSNAAGLVWPALEIEVMMLKRQERTEDLATVFKTTVPTLRAHSGLPPAPAHLLSEAATGA